MKWKHPPVIKIYEALGTVADGRIEISEHRAKVYSSSRNKFYDVSYGPQSGAIMANDNGSFWKGYLGYPSIVLLMNVGVISYNKDVSNSLKDIAWKDINQKYNNDFDKTKEEVLGIINERGFDIEVVKIEVENIMNQLRDLNMSYLGKKQQPPKGY